MYTATEYKILERLQSNGILCLTPDMFDPAAEGTLRNQYNEVVLQSVLNDALVKMNPGIPVSCIHDAVKKVMDVTGGSHLLKHEQNFQLFFQGGVEVSRNINNTQHMQTVRLIDSANLHNNWIATTQMVFHVNETAVKSDVLIFLNGIPVVVMSICSDGEEKVSLEQAFTELTLLKNNVPQLFTCNPILVISDGEKARYGSPSIEFTSFLSWQEVALLQHPESEFHTLLHGLKPERILRMLLQTNL